MQKKILWKYNYKKKLCTSDQLFKMFYIPCVKVVLVTAQPVRTTLPFVGQKTNISVSEHKNLNK